MDDRYELALAAIKEELSYIARDVEWLANAGCQTPALQAARQSYIQADAARRIALRDDSDAIGREEDRGRLARSLGSFEAAIAGLVVEDE